MTTLHRIRLDFSPAFLAILALWAGAEVCHTLASDDLPWSVASAHKVGLFSSAAWWIWSDSVRRSFPLLPVWGSFFAFFSGATLLFYLFRSRGLWGVLTLALYSLALLSASFAISFFFG